MEAARRGVKKKKEQEGEKNRDKVLGWRRGRGNSRGTGAGKREGAVKVKLSVTRWEGVGWGSIWR